MKRFLCWLFGHRYFTRQAFTPETRRVGCKRCPGDWAMNDRVQIFVPWTDEFTAFYQDLGHIVSQEKAT